MFLEDEECNKNDATVLDSNVFDPQGIATRAEVSALLNRFA